MHSGTRSMAPGISAETPKMHVGGLVVSLLLLCSLGALELWSAVRNEAVEPRTFTEADAPATAGEWTLQGLSPEPYLQSGYPVGSVLLVYRRSDGAKATVTAAAGQERYGAFANISPTFLAKGHEIAARPSIVIQMPDGHQVRQTATLYHPTSQSRGFAFFGIYPTAAGKVYTSLTAVKLLVTLRRAVGVPMPTLAAYFASEATTDADPNKAAEVAADLASALMPALEEFLKSYATGTE